MQITLSENEIKVALEDYVAKQGIQLDGITTEINLSAGRGTNGHTAEINLIPKGTGKKKATPSPKKVAVRTIPSAPENDAVEKEPEATDKKAVVKSSKELLKEVADGPEDSEKAEDKVEESKSLFG